ncbi:DUF6192 family protein [Streptomyces sp. 184]|uniref:DUF6192 family protein n=1 Tax=Streptomyces sp. 184 TaxID=1827526 RepID=UPI003892BEF6
MRRVGTFGRQVDHPVTPQEKITAIHCLPQEAEVAAAVTTDFSNVPRSRPKSPRGQGPSGGGIHPR